MFVPGAATGQKMDLSNPFAAFLAARPTADTTLRPQKVTFGLGRVPPMGPMGPMCVGGPTPPEGPHDGPGYGIPAGADSYASFLARRPLHPSQEVEILKADVLRTKKELLEVALEAELKAARGELPEEATARLHRVRTAQRYLYHPERILEPFSGSASAPSEQARLGTAQTMAEAGTGELLIPSILETTLSAVDANDMNLSGTNTPGQDLTAAPHGARRLPSRDSNRGSTLRAAGGMATGTASASASAIGLGAMTPPVSPAAVAPYDPASEQLLNGWWTKTRCFNIKVGKGDLKCRRHSLAVHGGCLAFGNGRLPLYTGSHLLCTGYYVAFRVDAMDAGQHGTSMAMGISRLSPAQERLQGSMCPLYGYEVPGAVIVGYSGHFIDEGKWYKTPWDSDALQVGDRVGLLITQDGELVVFHNETQVLRTTTSLASGASTRAKKKYFGMVDLSGRVSELTLLPQAEPPNVPLQLRDHLERKLV